MNRYSFFPKNTYYKIEYVSQGKFLASGKFEKLKARLVAGGDQQHKTLYDDLPAPTVGTSSVFTLLSIAASEDRKVTAIDISGAYLNADMDMRLDKNMTGMMFTPYHDATCQYKKNP